MSPGSPIMNSPLARNPLDWIRRTVSRTPSMSTPGLWTAMQVRVARFDAQGQLKKPGRLEHVEQGVVGVPDAHGAVELHAQGPGDQPLADSGDARGAGW